MACRALMNATTYHVGMARGWESKNIEDQQSEAERQREVAARRTLTPEQVERAKRRETLTLSRTSTLQSLQGACHAQHRALLERTLTHIDAEIAAIDVADMP